MSEEYDMTKELKAALELLSEKLTNLRGHL